MTGWLWSGRFLRAYYHCTQCAQPEAGGGGVTGGSSGGGGISVTITTTH